MRANLPATEAAFVRDRDARDIVVLNLFVAIQACLDLATHWVADAGWSMPGSYAEAFRALADHDVISHEMATRLSDAAGFRNLVAHQYAVIDPHRVYGIANSDLGDLDAFCATLARHVSAAS